MTLEKVLLVTQYMYIMTTQLIESVACLQQAYGYKNSIGCLGLLARRTSFETIALSLHFPGPVPLAITM